LRSRNPSAGESEKIPLLMRKESSNERGYGKFDVANYFNQNLENDDKLMTREFNVGEHVDPVLFSISFGSSAGGLQLYEYETDTWIAVPNHTTVLWCGSEAELMSGGMLKACWHRVVFGNVERMTMWYEVCTFDQVSSNVQNGNMMREDDEKESVDLSNMVQFYPVVLKTLTGKSNVFMATENQTLYDVLVMYQEVSGIPPDQIGIIIYKKEKVKNVDDLLINFNLKEGPEFLLTLRLR